MVSATPVQPPGTVFLLMYMTLHDITDTNTLKNGPRVYTFSSRLSVTIIRRQILGGGEGTYEYPHNIPRRVAKFRENRLRDVEKSVDGKR